LPDSGGLEAVGSTSSATIDAGKTVTPFAAPERNRTRNSDRERRILWVDDRPESVAAVQRVFENYNMRVTNALDTDHALALLAGGNFDAIISDMSRGNDSDAGHTLLKKLRAEGNRTPYYIFSTRSAAARADETRALGGNGNTSNAADLLRLLTVSWVDRAASSLAALGASVTSRPSSASESRIWQLRRLLGCLSSVE
jgi:CheY-like chemotaxis protein